MAVVHCCGIETMSGDTVDHMNMLVANKAGLETCVRCGQRHEELEWQHLTNPVSSAPEGVTPSAIIGYTMCPVTNQPVFVQGWDMGDDET